MLADLTASGIRQAIDPEAVVFRVDFSQQPAFQFFHLRKSNLALKDGFLDALANPFTNSCDATQSAAASPVFRVNVVADDDKH